MTLNLFTEANLNRRLANGRAAERVMMTSRCTIRHPDPDNPWTPGPDGFEVPAWLTDYTDHPCELMDPEPSRTVVVGDVTQEQAVRRLRLPHDTRTHDGAVIRLDSGEWVGTFWKVTEATGADNRTALRVRVSEVPEPEGWSA
jgi:hypothetical protein